MAEANDIALVREFAAKNSETAFAELVRRHINLVYSVAFRFTGNSADAQDVTQAVFILLARKAARLSACTVMTGWFYETTRFTATRLLRTRARRRAYEHEASMQSMLDPSGADIVWRQLAPHLEAAVSKLRERDRTLLALRFYENMSGAEAAKLLGIHEDAARKRANRALERLRKFFSNRGVHSSAEIIAAAISANSIQTAPAALAKSVTAVALAKVTTASTSTLNLIKRALKIMAWTKAKTAVVISVAVMLATTTTTIGIKVARAHHPPQESADDFSPVDLNATFDIQSDGKLLFRATLEETNDTSRTVNPVNADSISINDATISRVTDEDGKPMKFTRSRDRFYISLNRPVPPGGTISYSMEGIAVGGFIQTKGANQFGADFTSNMGNGTQAHVVQVWRLPPGATLLQKDRGMDASTNEGRIELRIDKLVPPNGGFPVVFDYRLPAD